MISSLHMARISFKCTNACMHPLPHACAYISPPHSPLSPSSRKNLVQNPETYNVHATLEMSCSIRNGFARSTQERSCKIWHDLAKCVGNEPEELTSN